MKKYERKIRLITVIIMILLGLIAHIYNIYILGWYYVYVLLASVFLTIILLPIIKELIPTNNVGKQPET